MRKHLKERPKRHALGPIGIALAAMSVPAHEYWYLAGVWLFWVSFVLVLVAIVKGNTEVI